MGTDLRQTPTSASRWSRATTAVLFVALILRLILAARGGQRFWADEERYVAAEESARALLAGHVHEAGRLLFIHPDHLLFRVISVLPALVEEHWHTALWIPGLFYAVASFWVIALIPSIARAAGADEEERFVATLLAAGSSCLFYYSRHFFPYDLALGFALTGLWLSLRKPDGWGASIGVGCFASLGFLTYNGYWTIGGAVLILRVLQPWSGAGAAFKRAVGGFVGLLIPVAVMVAIGRALGTDLVGGSATFSGTITQGDFRIAWRFIPEYFAVTEHLIALVWLMGLAGACVFLWKRALSARSLGWLIFVLAAWVLLVVPSDVVTRFAVSARHARILAPGLCLLAASVLTPLLRAERRRRWLWIGVGVVVVQAGYDFSEPLRQEFINEFLAEAKAVVYSRLPTDIGPYEVLNATYLHDPSWVAPMPDDGQVILQRNHPFHFKPFLYEGYPERERKAFLASNLTMRVVDRGLGGPFPAGVLPGALKIEFMVPQQGAVFYSQPILTTGAATANEQLFLAYEDPYEDPSLISIGWFHAGGPGSHNSPPFHVDTSKRHTVTVAFEGLYPPGKAPAEIRGRLFVRFDDKIIFDEAAESHAGVAGTVAIGTNLVHGPDSVENLMSRILSLTPVADSQLASLMADARRGPPEPLDQLGGLPIFHAYPGPVSFTLTLRASRTSAASEPLLSSGIRGLGDLLFLQYLDPKDPSAVVVGIDHWGGSPIRSEPLVLDRSKPHRFTVSLGSLYPPLSDALFKEHPEWRGLKRRLYVAVDGKGVLDMPYDFHPTRPEDIVLGRNFIGATSSQAILHATLDHFDRLPIDSLPGTKVSLPKLQELHGYPGPIEITMHFARDPGALLPEPILASGVTGRGDVLFIRYPDPTRPNWIAIGHDHWGGGAVLAPMFEINRTTDHVIGVSMGCLLPEAPASGPEVPAVYAGLRKRLIVTFDGRVVFNQAAEFHPSQIPEITLGANLIGASSSAPTLLDTLLDVKPANPDEISRVGVAAR